MSDQVSDPEWSVELLAKLEKLIPRLASEHGGEIVATVNAMRRILSAGHLDLHDLAALVTKPQAAAPHSSAQPQEPPPPKWHTEPPPRPQPAPRSPPRNAATQERDLDAELGLISLLDVCFEYLDYARESERSFLRKIKWNEDHYKPVTREEHSELERLYNLLPNRRRKYRYQRASKRKIKKSSASG